MNTVGKYCTVIFTHCAPRRVVRVCVFPYTHTHTAPTAQGTTGLWEKHSTHTGMKTFKCDFGRGITATVQTTDDPPASGQTHVRGVEWTGSPNRTHLRPYIGWMNSVNQTLADEWRVKLAHVYVVSPSGVEVWVYEPQGRPKKINPQEVTA